MGADSVEALIATHHCRYAPVYGGGLSDHGPMALLAMRGLDLPEPSVRAFADYYVEKLEPLAPSTGRLDTASYAGAVGGPAAYPALLDFFVAQVADHGPRVTTNAYLPALLSGWAGAAFHPLIRLGYGLEFGIDGEVAAGLAYFAQLGPHAGFARHAAGIMTRPPGQLADAARQLRSRSSEIREQAFPARLARVLSSNLLDDIGPPEGGLCEVSAVCREMFAASHNFFALHLVTGTHALRVCLDHLDSPPGDMPGLIAAGVLAAYVAIGAPRFSATTAAERDQPDFDTGKFLERTRDEHHLKLAYSCAAQAAAYADPVYLAAARGYLAHREY